MIGFESCDEVVRSALCSNGHVAQAAAESNQQGANKIKVLTAYRNLLRNRHDSQEQVQRFRHPREGQPYWRDLERQQVSRLLLR